MLSLKKLHGGLESIEHHLGDFGNIEAAENGTDVRLTINNISLFEGPYSILGKTIVVHNGTDDLGESQDETGDLDSS